VHRKVWTFDKNRATLPKHMAKVEQDNNVKVEWGIIPQTWCLRHDVRRFPEEKSSLAIRVCSAFLAITPIRSRG
jgi:hypothetical protein